MSYKMSDEMKEHMERVDQIGSDLDERCNLLLVFFTVLHIRNPGKMFGFNEIYRLLDDVKQKEGMKKGFTRQTLSLHLKHLLEKDLIEVREEKESKLKIKPRKYRISKFYLELIPDMTPLEALYDEEILKEFKPEETEPLTVLLLRMYMILCTEIFRKTLAIPEIYGTYFRDRIYHLIENLTKAYRTTVFKRNESETALRITDEFGDFVKQKLNEKYGPLRRGE